MINYSALVNNQVPASLKNAKVLVAESANQLLLIPK
jgi:hypothetical protein